MKNCVIVSVGPFQFGVDAGQLTRLCPERQHAMEVLQDWQEFKKSMAVVADRIELVSLFELLLGRKEEPDERQRLAILSAGEDGVAITIGAASLPQEVTADNVQPLPAVFSPSCRTCFPQAVVCGDLAVPILDVAAVRVLAARNAHDAGKRSSENMHR